MANRVFLSLTLLIICALSNSTPVKNGNEDEQQTSDKEVKELENLRAENHNNGVPAVQNEPTEPPKSQVEPQPNRGSAIFRHRGITQTKKNKYWNEKQRESGVQYSPADLAAYVFNTGDEEGVAVAVEELVREGMMGRTDAINYLQDVKQILNDMREQRRKIEEFRKQLFVNALQEEKREVTTGRPAVIASEPKVPPPRAKPPPATTVHPPIEGFTLDVIYKLAKDMFTQSILRDDPTAEETLSGLVTYLESEVGNKRISPAMKERVLELVSSALVDSLREYQGLASQTNDGLYRPAEKVYNKLGVKGPENVLQIASNKPKSS